MPVRTHDQQVKFTRFGECCDRFSGRSHLEDCFQVDIVAFQELGDRSQNLRGAFGMKAVGHVLAND